MMNLEFDKIIGADDEAQSDIYSLAAERLDTTPQNIEKDFWVCWTLDALFNGLSGSPRLLFKGGTSLSKGFDLIKRFSEDIDITVFREDLGEAASMEELRALSGKKRRKRLDAIKEACEEYIQGACLNQLSAIIKATAERNKLSTENFYIEPDSKDSQTLLLHYPTATFEDPRNYIEKVVKIESGAKSALDPNSMRNIQPYLKDEIPGTDLNVRNVTTVDAERTLWDKVVILHGLRNWFNKRGELRGGGQRLSRHYYDLFMLLTSEMGQKALEDRKLGADCVEHARMFFDRPDYNLAEAKPPTFSIRPEGEMIDVLRRDYDAMSGMIFGDAPAFEDIMSEVTKLEAILNQE